MPHERRRDAQEQSVEQLLDSAQHGHRCAYACNRNERVALARRARSGELNQVFRNCYVRPDYWDSLRPAERTWHICRTVNQYNPGVVFAGKTAATLLGFPLSHAVHDGTIVCAARRNWIFRTDSAYLHGYGLGNQHAGIAGHESGTHIW